jgi:hypothetical protein
MTWKNLSVLCLLALAWVAPVGAEPFDFARENGQVFPGNDSMPGFYVSKDFVRIGDPGRSVRNAQPLPLPNIPDSEREKRPRFWRDSLIMYGAMWMFTFTVNYGGLGNKIARDASLKKLGHHFVTPPELNDGDPFVTNYIAHPMFGGFTYHVFRQRGHSAGRSLYASALHSALFEYTIEGFIQRPSGVDLLVTPLIGAPIGARLGKWILPVSVSIIVVKYLFRSPL